MDRLLLELQISSGKTLKQISKELNSSQTNTRYWIKKYGLKLHRGPGGKLPSDIVTPRHCKCGETDPLKFYDLSARKPPALSWWMNCYFYHTSQL